MDALELRPDAGQLRVRGQLTSRAATHACRKDTVHHGHGYAQSSVGRASPSLARPQTENLYRTLVTGLRRIRVSVPRSANIESLLSGHLDASQPQAKYSDHDQHCVFRLGQHRMPSSWTTTSNVSFEPTRCISRRAAIISDARLQSALKYNMIVHFFRLMVVSPGCAARNFLSKERNFRANKFGYQSVPR